MAPSSVIEYIKNPESNGPLRARAQRNFVVFHAHVGPHLLDFLTLSGMASRLTRKEIKMRSCSPCGVCL